MRQVFSPVEGCERESLDRKGRKCNISNGMETARTLLLLQPSAQMVHPSLLPSYSKGRPSKLNGPKIILRKHRESNVHNSLCMSTHCAFTSLGYSKKGWTDGEIGVEWIKIFEQQTRQKANGRDRLLLVDGHNSHYTRGF